MPAGLPILMFHAIDDAAAPTCFPPRQFRRAMAELHAHGYRTLRFSEAAAHLQTSRPLPERCVVLESMACATPVIVRDAGGSTEPIETTGGGVVYRDPAELRQALHRTAADNDWRASLARNARVGYQRHYSTAAHLRRYYEIIAGVNARSTAR